MSTFGDHASIFSLSTTCAGDSDVLGPSASLKDLDTTSALKRDTMLTDFTGTRDQNPATIVAQVYLNSSPYVPSRDHLSVSHHAPSQRKSYMTDLVGADEDIMDVRSSFRSVGSPSSPLSPLRASHDLAFTGSFNMDADSGISNTLSGLRYKSPVPISSPRRSRTPDPDLGVSRSFDMTSPRSYAKSVHSMDSSFRSPSRIGTKSQYYGDLHSALEESESRRNLLMDRLREAQETIRMQTKRLEQIEDSVKDGGFEMDDLKFKEKESKKKIANLERERYNYQNLRLESLKEREAMQERIDTLDLELRSSKSQNSLLQAELKKKNDIIEQTNSGMSLLEQESSTLHRAKESMTKEVTALKESLEIARSRSEYLENQHQDAQEELHRLREDTRAQAIQNKDMNRHISELKKTRDDLKEESHKLVLGMKAANEEKQNYIRQMDQLQDAVSDLRGTLAATAADKERFFQEKLDLHQRLQNFVLEKEQVQQAKSTLEEQLSELNAELAQAKLEIDKKHEENRKLDEELSAVKKVGEVLSSELSTTKASLERLQEQNTSLEHSKKLAFQQHSLYEQEVKSLENQIENMRKSMETLKKDHLKDKETMDEHNMKLKEENRKTRNERNQLETRIHELEAKVKQAENNLMDHSELQQKELDSWRTNCEKLTASLSRKEMELQSYTKRLQDLEDETNYLKVNHETYKSQYDELTEARENMLKLQEENRRLLQERAENQQVIQLLEMQKNILSKTAEGNLGKVYDVEQLQCKVDQLNAENELLQDKVTELERVRDDLVRQKEQRLAESDMFYGKGNISDGALASRCEDLEQDNNRLHDTNQMITEQLTKLEKENAKLKNTETVPRIEFHRVEQERIRLEEDLRHLKAQYDHLETSHHKMLTDQANKPVSVTPGEDSSSVLRKEKTQLEAQVALLNSQFIMAESGKKRADDQIIRLEKMVKDLTQKLERAGDGGRETAELEEQCRELQAQLDNSKEVQHKQHRLIKSLKEELEDEKTKKPSRIRQSLDDVGEELNQMRTELHKLMEVIQVKDTEIEDLEKQLKNSKDAVASRDKMIEQLKISTDRPRDRSLCNGGEADKLGGNCASLEKKNSELSVQVLQLTQERDQSVRQAKDMHGDLDDLQGQFEEERTKLQEKFRKELCAKDRQIESLEEQLRQATENELKKLKRDASRVELLKSENQVIRSQLKRNCASTSRNLPAQEEEQDSWDDSSIDLGSPTHHAQYDFNNLNLTEELQEAHRSLNLERDRKRFSLEQDNSTNRINVHRSYDSRLKVEGRSANVRGRGDERGLLAKESEKERMDGARIHRRLGSTGDVRGLVGDREEDWPPKRPTAARRRNSVEGIQAHTSAAKPDDSSEYFLYDASGSAPEGPNVLQSAKNNLQTTDEQGARPPSAFMPPIKSSLPPTRSVSRMLVKAKQDQAQRHNSGPLSPTYKPRQQSPSVVRASLI